MANQKSTLIRSEHLHIRVTPGTKEKLRKLAEHQNRSLSDMMSVMISDEYLLRMATDKSFARKFK